LSEPRGYEDVKRMFGQRVAALDADRGPAYRTRGSIDWMLPRVSPRAKAYLICQEFGTYGPLAMVQALREENRWHHYGNGTIDHSTKKKLKETFYPDDDTWRVKVLRRGQDLFNQVIGQLLGETGSEAK